MTQDYEELEYEELRSQKVALDELLDSRGWKLVESILQERVETRKKELMHHLPSSIESMVAHARIYGGLEELELIPTIVAGIYSETVTQLEKISEEMEDATGSED